jgi:putative RNA 2'-phosphotransferase
MDNNKNINLNKYLCLILRHKPEIIGVELDKRGWTDVALLIENLKKAGKKINLELLKQIVDTDNKNRFSFDESYEKIRANQGHSIKIDLGYKTQQPPDTLYHGTAKRLVKSIMKNGLDKRNRHHVHLSLDVETAINVGKRHGEPHVFKIFAGQMFNEGFQFYFSDNGVWLTDNVPIKYLSHINN